MPESVTAKENPIMTMIYRRLGASNLRVSRLCLGTMMFGDQTEAPEAASIMAAAREQGVNFVDTADVYTRGASERMLAPLIKAGRDWWVVATKLANRMSDSPNDIGYSRRWMIRAVENSLQRLETDYLDILYLHRDHEHDSLEEAVRTMGDLIRDGKIRYWGLSNFRGWRVAEAARLADNLGVPRPTVCQPYYNLLNRMPEVEILPACRHYGLGVVPYSPIARGVLTGKYRAGQAPEAGTRAARKDARMMQTEWREESLLIAERLAEHAEARGVSLLEFSVAWVLANPIVSAVIAGPRTLAQWQSYAGALTLEWGPADEAAVDRQVVPGHASTPGYHDPQYPFFGRPL
ncbi:MAG: aldo/keto reductase [Burkholderiaceae bacterium]